MKQLLILRHAKSSWKDTSLRDFDRPLNTRGRRDAPRMGRLLAERELTPDLILTSAAERARLTAEAVARECSYEGELTIIPDLYMAWPSTYIAALNRVPDATDRPMVVGHNPGIEDFVELLTGNWERMPTAALAHLELDIDDWHSLTRDTPGRLLAIWRPKEI